MLNRLLAAKNPRVFHKKLEHAFALLGERYPYGDDPWGLNLKKVKQTIETFWFLYEKYFRVRVFGKNHVDDKPYMVISNHTGQIPLDGILIGTAFIMEIDPPRILRAMVERFVVSMPFLSPWSAQRGGVLGDRQNCMRILENGESILVFPEGVRGISKNTKDYYKTVPFSQGFFRMALRAGSPEILPVAVVGAEEMFPFVHHFKSLAYLFHLPSFPVSMNLLPLPSPIDIYIGKPYKLPMMSADAPDSEIDEHVSELQRQIQEMIDRGLQRRRPFPLALKKGGSHG